MTPKNRKMLEAYLKCLDDDKTEREVSIIREKLKLKKESEQIKSILRIILVVLVIIIILAILIKL